MLHNCNYCDHTTTVKSNLRRHIKNKHQHTNHATPKMSVQQNVNQASSNIQNQQNSQYGTGQNTHYNIDYIKVVGIANSWKKECEVKDNAIHA